MSKPRNMAMLAFPGVQLLDVSGPLDVLAEANRRVGKTVYQPVVVAPPSAPSRARPACV